MIRGIKEIIPTNCDVPYVCKRQTRVSGSLTLIKGPVSWSHYIFESWLQRTYMCKIHMCVGFLNCVYLLFDTTVWCCNLCNIFYFFLKPLKGPLLLYLTLAVTKRCHIFLRENTRVRYNLIYFQGSFLSKLLQFIL